MATKPVEAVFVVVAHTDCDSDIRGLAGFKSVAEYGTRQPLCPEEIGSVEEFRFVLSPVLTSLPDAGGAKGSMVSTGGTSADVYPMVVLEPKLLWVSSRSRVTAAPVPSCRWC